MRKCYLPTQLERQEKAVLLATKLVPSTTKQNCLLTSQLEGPSFRKPSLILLNDPSTCSGLLHPCLAHSGTSLCGDLSVSPVDCEPQEGRARTVTVTAVSPAPPTTRPDTKETFEEVFAECVISIARLPMSGLSLLLYSLCQLEQMTYSLRLGLLICEVGVTVPDNIDKAISTAFGTL